MDKPTDKEEKTSVKLDGRQRKLLGTIDKESKWKDLKSIAIISNELEGLDIGEDFIGLGCSRYLNEAGANGRLDVEEMFRNCREAEKVRQRVKKKDKKERIEKQKRAGRGRGGTDKALLAQQKDTQKEDSKLGDKNKETLKRIKSTADEISKIISQSSDPKDWKDQLMTLGLKVGFDTLTALVISVAETYPNLFNIVGGTLTFTASALSFLAKTYGIVETGEMLGINYLLRKLKALIGWLKRNGMDGLLRSRGRGGDGGGGGGGGGGDDDDDDGGRPPPPSRRDEGGMDFVLMLDADKLRELLDNIGVEEAELDETTIQQEGTQTAPAQSQLAIMPPPPQESEFRQYNRMLQAQHTAKAEQENRENFLSKNPMPNKEQPTGQGELNTETPPITRERVKEEMGQGEKVKDVEGEKMGSKSSDLTGLNTGIAVATSGLWGLYNGMFSSTPAEQTTPQQRDNIPTASTYGTELVGGRPIEYVDTMGDGGNIAPTQEDLARPFRQPAHGGMGVEGDGSLLQGRQPFQGEGRSLRDSLVNQPQQPSTSQSGNLLEPRQNVNLEIRDLGMDGEPLQRTNIARSDLTRINERVGGAGSSQTTTMGQQTDLTSQNLEEMREGEEARKTEIDQQLDQLEQLEKEVKKRDSEIKKTKDMADEAHRKKAKQEKDVKDYIDMMGRNSEAWGAFYGIMGGGQPKTLEELNSLYGNILQSSAVASRTSALQALQANTLLQTRTRVGQEREREQMELLEQIEEASRQTRETARQGVSEAQRIASERQVERDRLQALYDIEREPRPIPQLREFRQLQLGSNIDNRLNVLVNLYNDWRPTPQDTRPRTNVVRPSVVAFLENFTTLNNMERADLVSGAFNQVRVSSLIQNSDIANRWINDRIINELDAMEEERARENMERRERGQRPLRPIYLEGRDATLRMLNATPMREQAEGAEEEEGAEERNPFLPTPPRQPKELQKKKKKK